MKNFNLSEWALRHRNMVLYLILVLMAAGSFSYFKLGRAEDPEFTVKLMVVQAFWPGATARDMEQQVTDLLEKKLQETPRLDYLQSYSRPGESLIFVTLKDFTPPKEVPGIWYQVRKKLGDIRHTLPDGVLGPVFNDEFGDTFGTLYALTSDGFSHAELKTYVEQAQQQLLRQPDVSKVQLLGAQDEKIFVEISNQKLASLGLDPGLIINSLQQQNSMAPAGFKDTDSDRVHLRVSGTFDSLESIRQTPIQVRDKNFRLGDIARIYRGYSDPPSLRMRYQGEDAIGLAVSMRQGGNILALGEHLAQTVQQIQAELPVGIELHQVADQPQVVKHSVNEFMQTLLEALIIVLAVSFLSLGFRTGLVVALSIPLVLAITFLIMYMLNIDLQRISLGALIIALGLLVDDAIIAVEMMVVKMEQGWDRFRAGTFAYTSTAFPMLTGTLITAAGFMPVGFAKSSAGEYTFSIFSVVGIALLASWVVAVVFTPYIGYKLLPTIKAHAQSHEELYQSPAYRVIRRLINAAVRFRKTVILLTLAIFGLSIWSFQFVEQQFFPSSNRPELLVDLWQPEGASLQATLNTTQRLEQTLKRDKRVQHFVCYVGGGSPRFYLPLDQQLPQSRLSQCVVTATSNAVAQVLAEDLKRLFQVDFAEVRGRVNRLENGPPVGFPIQFRLSGSDPVRLRQIAKQVEAVVRHNPHTTEVNSNWDEYTRAIRIQVDQDKAQALGISSQRLSNLLYSLLNGLPITEFREDNKLIQVLLRSEESSSLSLSDLQNLNIYTHSGQYLPLGQIARIEPVFEEGIIWRRDLLPTITIRADIWDHSQAPVVSNAIEPELAQIRASLPSGYRLVTGGSIEESIKGQSSINAVMPAMFLAVMTLLMIQLQSMQRTLLVLLSAPLGIIGVSLFLLLFHQPFGFVAMLGVIALFGMIMRNSVILVDQIEQDIQSGLAPWHAIVESAVRRFRPIMLTAFAAILGMIPLATSNFWGPMAIAIMGGLLVATLLTLLFLPALYAAWFRVKPPVAATAAAG